MKIKVGIIGATGYAGVELIRLLLAHENAEITALSSISFEGKALSEVYPAFYTLADTILVDEDTVIAQSDVVFASLPHGLCESIAKKCTEQGKAFIDLGADFRLEDEAEYKEWYGLDYNEKALHNQAVYCIPELMRSQIGDKKIIANPGCYPTSIALGIAPAIKAKLIDTSTIIIDSKSGTTGAGRGLSQTTHFPDCNEEFAPYKVAQHRHTPEIEQALSLLASEPITITFVPHLLPVNRGILSTIYANLNSTITAEALHKAYTEYYQNEKFVRILPLGAVASIKQVKYTNICDISLHLDPRTNRIIIVSAIDNMVKGAAGQAIQNMNIMFGIKEDTGLNLIPPSF